MTAVAASLALLAAAVPQGGPTIDVAPFDATWRYAANGVAPPTNWRLPGFDDSSWPSGPAPLGFGDGDEATVVPSGPAGAVRLTTWFRSVFVWDAPETLVDPRLRLQCDDGAVVFLNGFEIARWNLPNGAIGPTTTATTAATGEAEDADHWFAVPPALLVAGANTLAVEVHQSGPTSSDLGFALQLVAGGGPAHVLRGPYLQNATPSAVTVRWRTDRATATQLWLGASPQTLAPAFFDATPRTEHVAVASGLPAGALRHYAIGDAAGMFADVPPATLRTLPTPGSPAPLRVWTFGDAGVGLSTQLAVRDACRAWMGARPADAMLLLGDNAYLVGTDAEYQNGFFDVYAADLRAACAWSAYGNHDGYSADAPTQTGPYFDLFTFPKLGEAGGVPSGTEAYYSFDRGHAHFVCLDSEDSARTPTGPMLQWLQQDLAAAQANGARWLIAFFHHPPYSDGTHRSDDPLDSGGRMADMRQHALPLLEAAGVDLVLSGHSHGYERSFLLGGHYGASATLQPGMVRDQGDGDAVGDGYYGKPHTGLVGGEGAVYAVVGSGGWLGGGGYAHPAMRVAAPTLGALVLDIDGDRLDASFVGLAGVADRFTIVKGDARTLVRGAPTVAVGAGGTQTFALTPGTSLAGLPYVLAGSFGSAPGIDFGGLHVPLNPDPWLQTSLSLANSAVYPGSIGLLDGGGAATAAFVWPPANQPSLVGLSLWHAFVVGGGAGGGLAHASNAVRVRFVP